MEMEMGWCLGLGLGDGVVSGTGRWGWRWGGVWDREMEMGWCLGQGDGDGLEVGQHEALKGTGTILWERVVSLSRLGRVGVIAVVGTGLGLVHCLPNLQ